MQTLPGYTKVAGRRMKVRAGGGEIFMLSGVSHNRRNAPFGTHNIGIIGPHGLEAIRTVNGLIHILNTHRMQDRIHDFTHVCMIIDD